MSIISTLRKPKIFGIAIFDLGGTLLAAYGLSLYFGGDPLIWMVGAIFLGIGVHYMVGVNTMLNYYIGLSDKPHRN